MKIVVNDSTTSDKELEVYEQVLCDITESIGNIGVNVNIERWSDECYHIIPIIDSEIRKSITSTEYKQLVIILYATINIISQHVKKDGGKITMTISKTEPSPFNHRVITQYFTNHGWLEINHGKVTIVEDKCKVELDSSMEMVKPIWKNHYTRYYYVIVDAIIESLKANNIY